MLGKKVAEMTAVTANKMLPSNNGQPRFETSCEGTGTMLGVEGQFMATYWAQINPDGSVYGECPDSGVVLTAEGPVTFRANGACLLYTSPSPRDKRQSRMPSSA